MIVQLPGRALYRAAPPPTSAEPQGEHRRGTVPRTWPEPRGKGRVEGGWVGAAACYCEYALVVLSKGWVEGAWVGKCSSVLV